MDYRLQKLNNTVDHSMYHLNFLYSWLNNFYNFFTKMFCCLNYYDCTHSCLTGCKRKPGKYCGSWFIIPRRHEIWYVSTFIVPLLIELTVCNGVFFNDFVGINSIPINQTSSQLYNYTYQIDFLDNLSEIIDLEELDLEGL
jgi:hypothetical protein